jgi:hypothetical protein
VLVRGGEGLELISHSTSNHQSSTSARGREQKSRIVRKPDLGNSI